MVGRQCARPRDPHEAAAGICRSSVTRWCVLAYLVRGTRREWSLSGLGAAVKLDEAEAAAAETVCAAVRSCAARLCERRSGVRVGAARRTREIEGHGGKARENEVSGALPS